MSDVIDRAIAHLNDRLEGRFDGSAKFIIQDEGVIVIDENGAHASDYPADVTLTADSATFKQILDGELDPTSAFMQGKLHVDGDMGTAMRLGTALS